MADYSREQLVAALRNAHNANDTQAASRIAAMLKAQTTAAPQDAAPAPVASAQAEAPMQEQPQAAAPESPIVGVKIPEALMKTPARGGPRAIDRLAEKGFSEAVATVGDGVILRNPQSGALFYTSPGRNIDDQALVQEMLKDRNLSGVQRQDARDTLDMNPAQKLGGLAANFVSGVPFVGSYVDEAAGWLADKIPALRGDAQSGGEVTNRTRAMQDTYQTAYPGRTVAAKVAGSLAAAPLAVEAAPAVLGSGGLGTQVARGVVAGAGLGALEGGVYGYGEGQNIAGESSRVDNAKQGAAFGGLAGGLVGGLVPVAGALGRSLYNRVAGREARQAARELGMRQDVAGLVADTVRADVASGSAQEAIARGGDLTTLGGLGPSTRGLLDSVANAPGQSAAIARENVGAIVDKASDRFSQTLDSVLGTPQGPRSLEKGVMDASRAARNDAYSMAYQIPIDYASEVGQRLESLLGRVDESVIRKAERLMRAEGVASQQIKATIGEGGRVVFEQMPDVRQIDYITRALKDSSSFGGGLGQEEARVVKGLASEIRSTLDNLVPEYGQARAIAADAISEREAVKFGRDLLKPSVTREDVAIEVAGMGKAELQQARAGLRSQIDDAMANVRRGLTQTNSDPQSVLKPLRDLTAPAAREKVAAILGPDEAEKLFATLDEAEQAFSMRVIAGSQTAPRLQTDKAIAELVPAGLADTIIDKGAGGALSSIAGKAAKFGGQTREQATGEVRSLIARVLTEQGDIGPRVAKLSDLADLGARMQAGQATAQATSQGLGAAILPGVAGATMRPEVNNRPAVLRRLADLGYTSADIVDIMNGGPGAIDAALVGGVQ